MTPVEMDMLQRRLAALNVLDKHRSMKRLTMPNVSTVLEFEKMMVEILNRPLNIRPNEITDRRMVSFFGAPPVVIAKAWELLVESAEFPDGEKPEYEKKHILWACHLLKVYSAAESVASSAVGSPDEKTFRKWTWFTIFELEALASEVVSCSTDLPAHRFVPHHLLLFTNLNLRRLFGKIDTLEIEEMIVLSQLMV